MLLSNELSIDRKIKEILLATRIDETIPKERILELYLNEIYLGSGAYGVAAAALTYFDKSLDELTLGEAAFLAGCRKRRTTTTRHVSRRRPRRVATGCSIAWPRTQPPGPRRRKPSSAARDAPSRGGGRRHSAVFRRGGAARAPARYGDKGLYEGGLSVRTSLDPRLQPAADKALRDGLIAYDRAVAVARRGRPHRPVDELAGPARRGSGARRGDRPGGSSRSCCAPKLTAR